MFDLSSYFNVNGGKTFRPTSGHRPGTRTFALHERYKKTLGTDDLRVAAALPAGEDPNEWIAMKTVDLFNEVELVHGMVSDYCTPSCCQCMSAGPKYEYLWADSARYPKPTKVSAPEYIGLLFHWVKEQIEDETLFPTQVGAPFPSSFVERVQHIFKRLFRVYAHIFYCHFERVVEHKFEAHLNSCFKHFMYFIQEFKLVRPEELKPLQPLMDRFVSEDDAKYGPRHPQPGSQPQPRQPLATAIDENKSPPPPAVPQLPPPPPS